MRKGTTKNGFEFIIDEEDLDDMEFIELLAEADENLLLIPKVLERMLGKEQKQRLYEFLRNDKGRVPTANMGELVGEILEAAGDDTKNS